MNNNPTILLTVDVEDWFQVENFKSCIPFSSWSERELRVEKNTHKLLDLFDAAELPSFPASQLHEVRRPKATFFVLAWLAERLPNLVREIYNRGHEIASHGFCHNLCTDCSLDELKKDLIDSKKLLEDITGEKVYGYRAPSFSINNDILRIIEECGYTYDSSYNSFNLHSRYGNLSLNGKGKRGIAHKLSERFYELPISNLKLNILNSELPWGGGGYFRLIPFTIFKGGIQYIINKECAYLFYMHPWEIDADQPRVQEAPRSFKFRHYINLKRCQSKLIRMIESFSHCNYSTCYEYILTNNHSMFHVQS